jgi:membrane protein required for colicin V production
MPAVFFAPYVKQQAFANLLGFLVILVAVQVAGFLLVTLLVKLTKKAGLGWLDRMLGAGFGVVRGLLISIVLVMVLTAFPLSPVSTAVSNSAIAPYVMEGARILVYLTPHEIRDGFQTNYATIRKKWKNTIEEALEPPPRALNF